MADKVHIEAGSTEMQRAEIAFEVTKKLMHDGLLMNPVTGQQLTADKRLETFLQTFSKVYRGLDAAVNAGLGDSREEQAKGAAKAITAIVTG